MSVEVRCENCQKLLFKIDKRDCLQVYGDMIFSDVIQIKCKCGHMNYVCDAIVRDGIRYIDPIEAVKNAIKREESAMSADDG